MSGRSQSRGRTAAVLLALAAGSVAVHAQPVGPTVRLGAATFQQLGRSLLVTTTNAPGTNRSVIDWRSFSVPAGSVTHFLQPGADSTSINRVTGNKPSEIFGTLSSNGHLVLVNPAGIAVGTGAVIDTAGFTASALAMSDDDAMAGRMRFGADKGKNEVDVQGRVLARNGDVVLIGTSVQVDQSAIVQASNGAVILAAGRQVALTGRGLEGIVLELTAPSDKAVNLGRLEGDAVGVFASQLKHSGVIQAGHVILQGDKVRLEQGKGQGKDDDKDKPPKGKPEGKGGSGGTTDAPPAPGAGDSGGADAAPPSGGDVVGSIITPGSGTSGDGSATPTPPPSEPPPPRSAGQAQVLLAAMESRAAASILTNGEVVAGLASPKPLDEAVGRPARAKADPTLQCTR
jgi:filamentous hemagglutinin family protein